MIRLIKCWNDEINIMYRVDHVSGGVLDMVFSNKYCVLFGRKNDTQILRNKPIGIDKAIDHGPQATKKI